VVVITVLFILECFQWIMRMTDDEKCNETTETNMVRLGNQQKRKNTADQISCFLDLPPRSRNNLDALTETYLLDSKKNQRLDAEWDWKSQKAIFRNPCPHNEVFYAPCSSMGISLAKGESAHQPV
jgi:hypothetical protein